MKTCARCGIEKSDDEFYQHKSGARAGSLTSYCQICEKERWKTRAESRVKRSRKTLWYIDHCQACGAPIAEGQIVPLQPSTTMDGIRAALNAAPGTAVLWKDNLTLVVWRVAEGFGFACLDCNGGDPIALFYRLTGGKGNYVLPQTMSQLAAALRQNGWQEVIVGAPAALQSALSQGVPVIGIMILPIGVIPEEAWTVQQ